MTSVPATRFASLARTLGAAARAAGLAVPAFRSPPRLRGARRTIRRYPGGAVVSVQLRAREHADVVDDMVDGVLAANRLRGEAASRMREALRLAVCEPDVDLTIEEPLPPTLAAQARVAERQTQAA